MCGHPVIGLKPKKTKKLSYWTLGVNPTLQRVEPWSFQFTRVWCITLEIELTDESNVAANSLKLDRVGPRSMSGWLQLRSTLKIACVAQAFVIT